MNVYLLCKALKQNIYPLYHDQNPYSRIYKYMQDFGNSRTFVSGEVTNNWMRSHCTF